MRGTWPTLLLVAASMTLSARQTPERPQAAAPRVVRAIVEDYATFTVGPVPTDLGYDPTFYKKYVDAHGIPVIGSEKVPDTALLVARDIVVYMLGNRPDIRREMIAKKYRVGIMAVTGMTTDIPEQRNRKKPAKDDPRLTRGERANYDAPGGIGSQTDKEYWDRRARGLGGFTRRAPRKTCSGIPTRGTTASTYSCTSGRTAS